MNIPVYFANHFSGSSSGRYTWNWNFVELVSSWVGGWRSHLEISRSSMNGAIDCRKCKQNNTFNFSRIATIYLTVHLNLFTKCFAMGIVWSIRSSETIGKGYWKLYYISSLYLRYTVHLAWSVNCIDQQSYMNLREMACKHKVLLVSPTIKTKNVTITRAVHTQVAGAT